MWFATHEMNLLSVGVSQASVGKKEDGWNDGVFFHARAAASSFWSNSLRCFEVEALRLGSVIQEPRSSMVSEETFLAYAPLTSWFPRALRTPLPCHYLWGFPSVSLLGTRLRLLLESIARSILLIKYARSDHKTDFCLRNRNSFTNL